MDRERAQHRQDLSGTKAGLDSAIVRSSLADHKHEQESAIKFLSYESAKRVFAQYWDKVPDQTMISNSSRFVAGGIGGVISQFCESGA